GNSQEVTRNGMWEANLFGEVDANKISLATRAPDPKDKKGKKDKIDKQPGGDTERAQLWDATGRSWDLHVENGRLFGVDPSTGEVLKGDQPQGAHLRVLQSGQPLFRIRIDGVRTIPTPVGAPDPVEVYTMVWVPQGAGTEAQLCDVAGQPL